VHVTLKIFIYYYNKKHYGEVIMKTKNKIYRLAAVILITLSITVLLMGCGLKQGSQSGGVISDIKISTAIDEHQQPINPGTVFPNDAKKFYCSFKLSGFPDNSRIKAEWVYFPGTTMNIPSSDNTSAVSQPLSFVIQTHTGTITGNGYTSVSMEVPTAAGITSENVTGTTWLAGTYKIVLYVDDQEKGSSTFEIKEVTGSPTE
jgi:hypothetical protein